jgi:hypothetical protein
MYDLSITLPKAWHVSRLAQAGKWRVRTQGDTIRMQIESHRGSKPVNSYAREADKVFAHHAKTSSYHLITLKPLNVLGKPGCYWEFRKAIGTHGLRRRVIVYFNTATHYVSLLFDCAEATFGAQETTVHEVLDHLANKG